ncbi:hypothetical protein DPSP01_008964 [Paraphaeosphaeria sporulosa]
MIPQLANSGRSVFIATSILVAATTTAFGLRVWARLLIKAWGNDDWLMLVGRLLFLAQPIVTPFTRIGSYYSHDLAEEGSSLTIAEYENSLRWHFFVGLLYTVNTTIVKFSICCKFLVFLKLYKLAKESRSASIATIARVPFLYRYQDPDDLLAKLPPIANLSNLKIMLGILAACIATMQTLLRYFPCLGAEIVSYGSEGTPHKVYKIRDLGTESGIQGYQDDLDRLDSRAFMLPQRPPGA